MQLAFLDLPWELLADAAAGRRGLPGELDDREPRPRLLYPPPLTRANNAVLLLADGQVDALANPLGGGQVHLVVDVVGYFQ